MDDQLSLLSFNVNGLAGKIKRCSVFERLKKHKCILFLQETHSSINTEHIWRAEWGSDIIFCHGQTNSKGVAIMLPSNLSYNINETVKDKDGRFIMLDIDIDDINYILVNVYAPTRDHKKEQITFIDYVKEQVTQHSEKNMILAGDYNFYHDKKLDKQSSMPDIHDNTEYRTQIDSLLEALSLQDPWRVQNPNVRRYTWHSRGKASRLDYCFLSEHLLNTIGKCEILPGIQSDHSILSIKLNQVKNLCRGRGLWKFNNDLLHDHVYVQEIKNIIAENKKKYADAVNKSLRFEILKMEIRSFTRPYCTKKKKNRQELKASLEKKR